MTTSLCLGLSARRVLAAICQLHKDQHNLITWDALDLKQPLVPERNLPASSDPALAAVNSVIERLENMVGTKIDCTSRHLDISTSNHDWHIDRTFLTLEPLAPAKVWLCATTPIWQEPVEKVVQSAAGHLLGTTLVSEDIRSLEFVHDLEQASPDVILCCGGYDFATKVHAELIWMAQLLGTAFTELGPTFALVLFAGNRHARDQFFSILEAMSPRTPVTPVESPIRFHDQGTTGTVHRALSQVHSRDSRALRLNDLLVRRFAPASTPHNFATNLARLCQIMMVITGADYPKRATWHSVDQRFDLFKPSPNPTSWQPVWSPGPHPAPATQGWSEPWIESGSAVVRRSTEQAGLPDPWGLLPVLTPLIEVDPGGCWPMLQQDFGAPDPKT